MEVNGQLHTTAALPPVQEPPCSIWIGGLAGTTFGLEAVEKRKNLITDLAGKWTPVVQPVAYSLYLLSYPERLAEG